MKSRLAVSMLFILIAASFTSDARGAFVKFRALTGNAVHRFAVEACDQISSHNSGRTTGSKARNEDKIKLVEMQEGRLLGDENCSTTKFMTTAARQVREVLALMRLQ